MPIIINEIEIAVEVLPNGNMATNSSSGTDSLKREEIIKECVEKVMDIINQKSER